MTFIPNSFDDEMAGLHVEPPEDDSAASGVMPIGNPIVRRNLMEQPGYSPYCGAERCCLTWPRTSFDGEQFRCRCGWRSAFPAEFIAEYKTKWGK